jgi:orotate phosphoribosyltransferase
MTRKDDIREKALQDLQQYQVLMLNGHFDFGNGYHGRVYLNPHQLFRYPSTIWRFAQDLLDVIPASVIDNTDVVSGPVTGGALLAHTLAGLLDSRRDIAGPPTLFAPFSADAASGHTLSRFYQRQVNGHRVLLVDDVKNTGQTLARCADVQIRPPDKQLLDGRSFTLLRSRFSVRVQVRRPIRTARAEANAGSV